ncbi:MAG TPA: UPF0182 family protein, partial [Nitriliruptorales bacterium]|nr:UPF0182 family protein [Nitriliruptorales bacterium]
MGDLLRRRLGVVLAVVVVLVLLSATRLSGFLTDLWWYQALGYRDVYVDVLTTQIGVGVVFGAALAALIGISLVVARRLRPVILPATAREAVIERYRQLLDPYVPWLIVGISLLFALSAGTAVAAQWERYLLWRHGGEFGMDDPQFGRDVGFYTFDLPWYDFVQGWLFTSLLLALAVTAGAHYLLGAIRPEAPRNRVTPQAKAHLSVLLALALGARAWGYWLDRFQLNFSPRGTVTGASYTDVNAELPALNLLLVVSAFAIVLVLVNIRRRGWLLPGAAIGLLVLASVLLQGIYPAAIQRLRVDPQELPREEQFIDRNLAMTRLAYGLDEVGSMRFPVDDDLGPEDVEEHAVTLNNVRLWSPEVLLRNYKQLQAIRQYYDFVDVDVDRYEVDGQVRQVMLSVRELSLQELDETAQTWQNLRLLYTHGHGMVSSQVNLADAEGQPVFLSKDIPPRGAAPPLVPETVPGIYFGEKHTEYSIVGGEMQELDFEASDTGEQQTTRYDGQGGVRIGGALRRLAFAVRFADPNLVLSGLIEPRSQIIFHRQVRERVQMVAPFLMLDDDPYAVVLDGRVKWIQDAYTVSADFPYSQRNLFETEHERRVVNYVRNSVKAVVDAYDGTVQLFVVDPDDPIVQAWRSAFPGPFADVSEAPEGMQAHFRYPEDMFDLQARVYRTYHIPGTAAFYSKADAWEMPPDPAAIANDPQNVEARSRLLDPYYLLMRLPDQETEEFVLIQPYLARNKPNMIAWLAGRSDPGTYGQLFAVQFPSDQTILGPAQAHARIEQDPTISEYITLRDRAGSQVIRGDLLVIPVERSILYVEPLFLQNPQTQIPELAKVAMVLGDQVVMEDTLDEALASLIGAAPKEAVVEGVPTDGGEPGDEEPEVTVEALIQRALERFAAADAALRDGDLAAYQRNLAEARRVLEQIAQESDVPLPGETAAPGA